MSVTITSGQELKEKLLKGINLSADTVTATLGSSGRPVAIRDQEGTIRITKDGYSVANAITSFEDPTEDMALQLLKAAAKKSVDEAGDGTTTTTLLVQSIVNECLDITSKETNVVEIQKGIAASVSAVVTNLKEQAMEITTEDQIYNVAKLSANGDENIAKLISLAIDKSGRDGSVSIEESKYAEDSLEEVEGMVLSKGLLHHHFVTDEAKNHSLLLNPCILLVDEVITKAESIVNFMQYAAEKERPLLLIAEGVEGAAISVLIVNHLRGTCKAAVIKSPDFGDRKKAILEDIATITGATVLSKEKGHNLEKLKDLGQYLGSARSVTSTKDSTTIIDGKGDKEQIEERLLAIKEQIDNAKSAFERENLQERLGKMIGGVVIINVGGKSEVEMKERRDRVEDALFATKAAIAEGVVPGGGLALINTESALDELVLANKDQEIGKSVIRRVLYAPFKKILKNAGIENHYEILSEIKANKDKSYMIEQAKTTSPNLTEVESHKTSLWQGYNVRTGEYGNVQEMGILDPVKVTRVALQNASSTAGILMTVAAGVNESKVETQQEG
jgi:chaperonin GroEL